MNNYRAAKEKARQEAMEWQLTFADHNYSYAELVEIQHHFEEVGKRYGLLTEFRDNGII